MTRVEQQLGSSMKETVMNPLKAKLWETLVATSVEKAYVPDRTRQQAIFDCINWETFRQEIAKERGRRGVGEGKRLRGKLFEFLVQADPAFGERSALEQELLALAHDPAAFGLEKELGRFRNPDMAFLIVQKDDGVMIAGVGESKLGLLNARSFAQLSETGFARGVKALVEVVNSLPNPEKHGLIEVARVKALLPQDMPLLRVADDFTQLLVVPANRNIEWSSALINRRELSAEGRKKFYQLLEDTRRTRTAKAAFSTAEVAALARACSERPFGI
jgi:hypothetical protein